MSTPRKPPVGVVVPCCNEEDALPRLALTLPAAAEALAAYAPHFLLVDDGSTDGTWRLMHELFGGRADVTLLRHDRNRGVAAAILTGIRHADAEVVCSMDSDCTYDPRELARMIPLLTEGVDLVTASPYHPRGRVLEVPRWRLLLSRAASRLYRAVLRQPLHTWTSCFRVYRRAAILSLPLREPGFPGVAELAALLDLRGRRIAEFPTTLAARRHGYSKINLLRASAGHARLLGRLLGLRLFRRASP